MKKGSWEKAGNFGKASAIKGAIEEKSREKRMGKCRKRGRGAGESRVEEMGVSESMPIAKATS